MFLKNIKKIAKVLFVSKKILIVDDEPFIRKVLGTELSSLGYTAQTAVDGIDCINKLQAGETFDLIILDVMMPLLDGFDTCLKIRQELKLKIPVLFLSANSLKASIIKAVQVGGNEYVVKEQDSTKLLSKIKELIG